LSAFGEPQVLPHLHALIGAEPGEQPPGGQWAVRNRKKLFDFFTSGETARLSLPPQVMQAIAARLSRVDQLLGVAGTPDSGRVALDQWFQRPAKSPTATVYVVARVDRVKDTFELRDVEIDDGATRQRAFDAKGVHELLRQLVVSGPRRWFAPRALDLLAAMVDANLRLPTAVVDPGLSAHALEPNRHPALQRFAPSLVLATDRVRSWMSDVKRRSAAPRSTRGLIDLLPDIDGELASAARAAGVQSLIENDIAKTLPPMARMEREGAWVDTPDGFPSWAALRTDLEGQLGAAEMVARALPYIANMYTEDKAVVVRALKTKGLLPPSHYDFSLTPDQQYDRFVALGVAEAVALRDMRRLGRANGVLDWVVKIETATHLRGVSVPQISGRWALRDLPLQNLPKKFAAGRIVRSGLRGPAHEVLVGADQNGFEVRLLADLSRDPVLLAASSKPDIHQELATLLSSSTRTVSRKESKAGMLAIMYGQTKDQFWRSCGTMPIADAKDLYEVLVATLPGALAYRRSVLTNLAAQGYVTTPGGWRVLPDRRRMLAADRRSAFNRVVQGLGADIQRWILRHLAEILPDGARVVAQAHDELFVACPLPLALHVEQLLVTAMTTDVMAKSGLLTPAGRLVATSRTGTTWGDLA
jgi:hypothetical protein